jgi:nucleotide-binding universal stress UspA family protein
VAAARFAELTTQVNSLPQLRQSVTAGADVSVSGVTYTAVVRSLLDFDQALVNDFGDPELSSTGGAVHNLQIAAEQLSLQHGVVLAAAIRGRILDSEAVLVDQSQLRYLDRIGDFAALATSAERDLRTQTLAGPEVVARDRMVQDALTTVVTPTRPDPPTLASKFSVGEWETASHSTDALMNKVLAGLDGPRPESVTVKAVHGFVVDELINAGKGADMLVLGSRGAGGFTRLMMGSVAGQVAQHAYCPVLIVPPENRA